MAKGNIFMGTLKGRVGNQVFYVKQGEQNVIKHQTQIANPQTYPQMFQRSRFLAANKFYTRGRQNFFKFAFENKKKSESDFNAFMRENIKRAPLITRDAFETVNYPVIGNFVVTRGSLPTINATRYNNGWAAVMNVDYPTSEVITVGDLSTALLKGSQYLLGDIITVLLIDSNTSNFVPFVTPSIIPTNYGLPNWRIIQFVINQNDTTLLSTLGLDIARLSTGQLLLVGASGTDYFPTTRYAAFTCVHSRNVNSRLKVSTQILELNEIAKQAVVDQQKELYINSVLQWWKNNATVPVQQSVILKGSIATASTPLQGITVELADNSEFSLVNNTFIGNAPIVPGSENIIGYITAPASSSALEVDRFTAILNEGGTYADLDFRQIDDHKVAIIYSTNPEATGTNKWTVGFIVSGQPVPLCRVEFVMKGTVVDPNDIFRPMAYVGTEIEGFSNGSTYPAEGIKRIPTPQTVTEYAIFTAIVKDETAFDQEKISIYNGSSKMHGAYEVTLGTQPEIYFKVTVDVGAEGIGSVEFSYDGQLLCGINLIVE